MALPLGHRQAIEIAAQTALKHGVAVDVQVVGRDGCRHQWIAISHKLGGLLGGDVLQHHPQLGELAAQRDQMPLDEHRFSIKDVDVGIGDLAVDQQGHIDGLHPLEHRRDAGQITHPRR